VVFFILSDDLTGAAGVASMVDHSTAAAVNLDRFDPRLSGEFSCIVLNLEIRERRGAEAARRLSRAMGVVGEQPVALRMDSALRGRVQMLVGAMLERGDVLVTDTIPDYGRRTVSGRTLIGAQRGDIGTLLSPLRSKWKDRSITIADSETYEDLDALAQRCIEGGLIPVDPGPLVARVAQGRLGLGAPALHRAGGRVSKVAFVVGTRDPMTLEQVRHMRSLGFPVQRPCVKSADEVDVFSFSIGKEGPLVTRAFLNSLTRYDALVLSGGATANFVLERSDFSYLVSEGQVQPLVSSSRVKGGLFDGKTVVLKGGFIGDENAYETILDWLRRD